MTQVVAAFDPLVRIETARGLANSTNEGNGDKMANEVRIQVDQAFGRVVRPRRLLGDGVGSGHDAAISATAAALLSRG